MISTELMLVCKIINDGSLKDALEWGITEDDFLTTEAKTVFSYVYNTYVDAVSSGSLIGPVMAKQVFSTLPLEHVDPRIGLKHLCQEVRNKRICIEVGNVATKAIKAAGDGKAIEAISLLQEGSNAAIRLEGGSSTDVDGRVGLQMMLERYEQRESGAIPDVISWPWGPVQQRIGGIRKSDFIIFYGRPKSMKTWIFTYFMHHAAVLQSGKKQPRVLVYTKEMIVEDLFDRWGSIVAGVDYNQLRLGKLSRDQRNEFFQATQLLRDTIQAGQLVMLSAKDVAGRDNTAWLRTKLDTHEPDVVFIDGLYLMSPNNKKITKDYDRVTSISRDMRQLILDTKIPVIATLQANRKAAEHSKGEMDEVAFSDAFSQDCTGAIRVINNARSSTSKPRNTISLVVAGSRDWNLSGWEVHGVPGINFDFVDFLSDSSTDLASIGDTNADSTKTPRRKKQDDSNEIMSVGTKVLKRL